jgi:hypothetical protein
MQSNVASVRARLNKPQRIKCIRVIFVWWEPDFLQIRNDANWVPSTQGSPDNP